MKNHNETGVRRLRLAAVGLVQVLLAVPMGAGGVQKLLGTDAMVDMFADIGAGQWLRVVVGALEIVGAVGLLVPRLSGVAALGLAGVLAGAAVTNVAVLDVSPALPLGLLALALLVVWIRRDQLPATPSLDRLRITS
ncbi:DoxX family protein [Nocardioides sp. GXZ039]|uniref:DoxX family protein n=1 Tax=Nocardioides sp. GXZ039 TaxID=3136018 RepID=UPI0030F3741B